MKEDLFFRISYLMATGYVTFDFLRILRRIYMDYYKNLKNENKRLAQENSELKDKIIQLMKEKMSAK